jgi:hypothetical protein
MTIALQQGYEPMAFYRFISKRGRRSGIPMEVPVSYRGKGGGFGSVETNPRVAKAAVEFVRMRYEQDGWLVRLLKQRRWDTICVVREQTNRYT